MTLPNARMVLGLGFPRFTGTQLTAADVRTRAVTDVDTYLGLPFYTLNGPTGARYSLSGFVQSLAAIPQPRAIVQRRLPSSIVAGVSGHTANARRRVVLSAFLAGASATSMVQRDRLTGIVAGASSAPSVTPRSRVALRSLATSTTLVRGVLGGDLRSVLVGSTASSATIQRFMPNGLEAPDVGRFLAATESAMLRHAFGADVVARGGLTVGVSEALAHQRVPVDFDVVGSIASNIDEIRLPVVTDGVVPSIVVVSSSLGPLVRTFVSSRVMQSGDTLRIPAGRLQIVLM